MGFLDEYENHPGNQLTVVHGKVWDNDEHEMVELPPIVGSLVECMKLLPALFACQPTPHPLGKGCVILTDKFGSKVTVERAMPVGEVFNAALADPECPDEIREHLGGVVNADQVAENSAPEVIRALEDLLKGSE